MTHFRSVTPLCLALAAGAAFGQSDDANRALINEIIDAAGTYVAPAGDCPPKDPDGPSTLGSWAHLPMNTNLAVVHGAMLPTNKIIWWSGELGGPLISGVFDLQTQQMTTQDLLGVDIVCGHQVMLADGALFSVGGGGNAAPGFKDALKFDDQLEVWNAKASMQFGRWYPTGVVLGNGHVAVFSGANGPVQEVEVYDPEADAWTTLPDSADKYLEIYPGMHVMPDGQLFYTGTRWNGGQGWGGATTALFDLETNTWTNVGNHIVGDRAEGMSVQLPEREPGAEPWRVIVAGGYANGNLQDTAEIIDLSEPNPQWQSLPDMHMPRNNANGVILPDGNVLFCTGLEGFKWSGNRIDSLEAEMLDPDTLEWTLLAPMSEPGNYHSISLLMPDGRVLKTGGHDGGPFVYDIEIYSPPYLFQGPRPEITGAPANLGYDKTFELDTPQAGDIQMVSMVRYSSITHHTNSDQRFVSLEFTQQDDDTLLVTSPAHANMAIPGNYMLHVVDSCGVPSHSEIVMVGTEGACYADFNGDGALNILDYVAFQNAFTAQDPAANCDGDTGAGGDPNFTILDFVCFQNAFTSGCP